MPRRKLTQTLKRQIATVRRATAKRKAAATQRKALRYFRPRKTEKSSFVFVSLEGKRIGNTTSRKGFMVYVTANGKTRLVKEHGKTIQPRRASTYKLLDTGKKRAIKKFYGDRLDNLTKTLAIRATKEESSSGVSYSRFAERLARDLRSQTGRSRSRGTYIVEIACIVELPDGEHRTFRTSVQFNKADFQILQSAAYRDFVLVKVYRFLAQELSYEDLVTKGSAQHVKRLKANQGKDRSEWVRKDGREWGKADFEQVTIHRIDYRISKVRR